MGQFLYDRFGVRSVPERQQADTRFTGRGVTIALIDSGFTLHHDLVNPSNRIVAYYDASLDNHPLEAPPEWWKWHGTMTSVVAAGSGHLSGGVYRGIASEANLVLCKASYQGSIQEDNVVRALEWILYNRQKYN